MSVWDWREKDVGASASAYVFFPLSGGKKINGKGMGKEMGKEMGKGMEGEKGRGEEPPMLWRKLTLAYSCTTCAWRSFAFA